MIEIPDETRKQLFETLQKHVREEFEEDLGVLRTEKLLDFVIRQIGSVVYNQAVSDAQAWMQAKLLDMEGDLFEEAGE